MSNLSLPSPFAMIIFGATGDLTQRKLVPALFHLFRKGVLPQEFFIVGFSRREYNHQAFKEFLKDSLKKYDTQEAFSEEEWLKFSGKIFYQKGDLESVGGYQALIELLKGFDGKLAACVPRFFYLATPPDKCGVILDFLHQTQLAEGCGQGSDKWTKVLVEKPFGRSLEEAKNLDAKLVRIFKEEQIFRIDHYLGKETVQNIVSLRYGNILFEPIWNRQFIDHIQITVAETVGIEARGNFYEGVGALRDMAQSHLLELLAAVAMGEPQTFDAEGIRSARARVIESINCIEPKDAAKLTVRGQYGQGRVTQNGKTFPVPAYREEERVSPTSNTETYVAIKLTLDDKRWQDMPFYLRTGKRLDRKATEISVVFKEPQMKLFVQHKAVSQSITNVLTFRIDPSEGIILTLNAKKPGLGKMMEQKLMSFTYDGNDKLVNPYERLLLDAMRGDQMLFTRTDEVLSSWEFVSKIAEGWWYQGTPRFPNYQAGSWGPDAAQELIEQDGRRWLSKKLF